MSINAANSSQPITSKSLVYRKNYRRNKNLYKRYILLWKEEVIIFNFRSVAEVVLLLFYKITYQGQGHSALSLETLFS